MAKKRFNLLTALTGLTIETGAEEESAEDTANALIEKLAQKARAQQEATPPLEEELPVTDTPVADVKPVAPAPPPAAENLAEKEAKHQRVLATQEIMDFITDEVNQEGPDFAEFMERLDSIRNLAEGTNMSEERIFQLAHLEFKGQVTRAHLLTTAAHYNEQLKTTFFGHAKTRLQTDYARDVKDLRAKAEELKAANQDLEARIRELQKEIADNIQKAGEMEATAAQNDISLHHKKAAYEFVIPAVIGQIDEVAQKIQKYIAPDEDQ
ncbi:MAG: hypothetical protein EAZ89_13340 [Bacteroidetes bacterium]|nr:MAG: hypothetical protein EAZ89_13340 [Bacteroidota bacterium]